MAQAVDMSVTPRQIAEQLAAGDGSTLHAMSANAKRKRYDFDISVKITEADSNKEYFDTAVKWTDITYAHMVIIEGALLEILNKLQKVGEIVVADPAPQP